MKDEVEQGFMTSQNRFVDRVEAWHIANDADQIKEGKKGGISILYSEDIY